MNTDLLRQLYRKYQNEIYLYLYSLSHNRELAQDLMQETFLKAILSLSDDHTNMRAWLYLVARNLYFNYINKEKDKLSIEDAEDIFWEDCVIDKIIAAEKTKTLYQAIGCLGRIKREVLVLRYFAGLSQKEIASVLNLTPENVRVLSLRGKKEIKKYMEAKGYDI